jgi:ribose transport system substrate-binding protein
MKRTLLARIACMAAGLLLIGTACSSSKTAKTTTSSSSSSSSTSATTSASSSAPTAAAVASSGSGAPASSAAAVDPTSALAALSSKVLSKGPHGETAASADSVTLSAAEIAKVQGMHATAAIALHYGGNDWSTAQVTGLKAEFAQLGIKVIATTDANFKSDLQVSQLETLTAEHPNIIVSIPTDVVATAKAYQAVAAAGIKLVFMDNVPNGMTAGKDYVSVVSADNYANGVASAYEMAKALNGNGTIGLIFHDADFFVTKQRYDGFKATIAQFPGIKIVAEKGIAGPDFAGDAQAAANAMLTQHPDLSAIWAVWDVPAEGVMAAARAAGKSNLIITTEDLGTNVAISLAQDGFVKGLGAQRPYDQGVTEAKLAAYGLLGKPAPAYVALNALPVDHTNVLDAWQQVYHAPPPAAVASAYKK